MINYIFLPSIDFLKLKLPEVYREWLANWLVGIQDEIEKGRVSSSYCIQGFLTELNIFGKIKTDWYEILKHYLKTDDGRPLAYSPEYGKKLYKFNHWQQTTIHAIHTYWWIGKQVGDKKESQLLGRLIEEFIQPNGWIYNPDVSKTGVNTRMKSELTMSVAMGLEILQDGGTIQKHKNSFEATLCSMPYTGFLATEYFRLKALELLESTKYAPVQLQDLLTACQVGQGYCDFSLKLKVDDYMGTAKRISRDKALHSAISGLHAQYIANLLKENALEESIISFGKHLSANPMDISAFKMRDIDVPFGIDITPFELMAAGQLISLSNE